MLDLIQNIVIIILFLAFAIGFPMSYKENNSWWFAIIKFYFGILPFIIGALGVFALGSGIAMAVMGITEVEYRMFTYIYLWCIVVLIPLQYAREKYAKFDKFIETI